MQVIEITPEILVIDTRNCFSSEDAIRAAAMNKFKLDLPATFKQTAGGTILSSNMIKYYRMSSIDRRVIVVSKERELLPTETRPIVLKYLAEHPTVV